MVQVCRDTRRTWKHDLTILQTVWRPGFKWKTGEWQCVWSRIKNWWEKKTKTGSTNTQDRKGRVQNKTGNTKLQSQNCDKKGTYRTKKMTQKTLPYP